MDGRLPLDYVLENPNGRENATLRALRMVFALCVCAWCVLPGVCAAYVCTLDLGLCVRYSSALCHSACVAVYCNVLQCVAMCCSVLQCVAVCCNVYIVLQCVAVCCNVL